MDDNNDGLFEVVTSGITSTSHIETGLSSGNSYKFRVKARNAVDFSSYSTDFTIVAVTVPSQPSAPTTTVSSDTTLILIDWNLPSDLGGLTISSYKLEIKTSTATF